MRSTRARGMVTAPPFLKLSRMLFSSISLKPETFIERPSVKRAMLALAGMASRSVAARRMNLRTTVNGQRTTVNELCPGMKLFVHLLQPSPRDVRVDLRRRDVGVPEHHLYGAQIGTVFQQMRGEGVPEHVRRDAAGEAGLASVLRDLHPQRLPRHRPAAIGEEEVCAATLIEMRPPLFEIGEDTLPRGVAERNDAFFRALPDRSQE